MEDLFKNSLMGELVKLGFDGKNVQNQPEVSSLSDNVLEGVNPLSISVNEEDIKNSPFAQKNEATFGVENPIKKNVKKAVENFNDEAAQKRLNGLDLNILQDSAFKKAGDDFSASNILGKILYKYFPNIYKGYLMKKALNKLKMINQTASALILKKIPYGESEERYDALSDYISNANTIHAKLMKRI